MSDGLSTTYDKLPGSYYPKGAIAPVFYLAKEAQEAYNNGNPVIIYSFGKFRQVVSNSVFIEFPEYYYFVSRFEAKEPNPKSVYVNESQGCNANVFLGGKTACL